MDLSRRGKQNRFNGWSAGVCVGAGTGGSGEKRVVRLRDKIWGEKQFELRSI